MNFEKRPSGVCPDGLASDDLYRLASCDCPSHRNVDVVLGLALLSHLVDENGNYTFGRYAKDPLVGLLTAETFAGTEEGTISYSFGMEPKHDDFLHYREPSDDGPEPFEYLGFYYDTSLRYCIDREGKVSLTGDGYNHPISGKQY